MSHSRSAGFSLLELLLVLFVIGLLAGLATLNLGGDRGARELDELVRHVAAVARYARDEAQFSGRDYGLRLAPGPGAGTARVLELRWLERREQGWQPPRTAAEVFAPLAVPPAVELQLLVEGVPVDPWAPMAAEQAAGGPGGAEGEVPPQVVFYAGGEATPGALLWRDRAQGELLWQLQWDLLGRLQLDDARSLRERGG
jgi:general secretion pathway protein H